CDRSNTKGLPYDNCNSIAEENNGVLWFATPQGLANYKNGTFTSYKVGEGKEQDRLWSVCASQQGGVWIATADGLKRFQNGALTRYSANDGLRSNLVFSVLEDADGTLWVGTMEGLQRRDPATGRFSDAWFPNQMPNKRVQCIFKDRAGNLWIGTEAAGVQRSKDGEWTGFTTRDGLKENRVDFV